MLTRAAKEYEHHSRRRRSSRNHLNSDSDPISMLDYYLDEAELSMIKPPPSLLNHHYTGFDKGDSQREKSDRSFFPSKHKDEAQSLKKNPREDNERSSYSGSSTKVIENDVQSPDFQLKWRDHWRDLLASEYDSSHTRPDKDQLHHPPSYDNVRFGVDLANEELNRHRYRNKSISVNRLIYNKDLHPNGNVNNNNRNNFSYESNCESSSTLATTASYQRDPHHQSHRNRSKSKSTNNSSGCSEDILNSNWQRNNRIDTSHQSRQAKIMTYKQTKIFPQGRSNHIGRANGSMRLNGNKSLNFEEQFMYGHDQSESLDGSDEPVRYRDSVHPNRTHLNHVNLKLPTSDNIVTTDISDTTSRKAHKKIEATANRHSFLGSPRGGPMISNNRLSRHRRKHYNHQFSQGFYAIEDPYALSELFSQSEIPGFREIFASDSYLRKFCWVVAFLILTILSLNDMTELLTEYYDYPITVDLRLRDSARLPFPAVTVCNLNVVKFSVLCSGVNSKLNLTNQIPSELRDKLCGIQVDKSDNETHESDFNDINNIGMSTTTSTTTVAGEGSSISNIVDSTTIASSGTTSISGQVPPFDSDSSVDGIDPNRLNGSIGGELAEHRLRQEYSRHQTGGHHVNQHYHYDNQDNHDHSDLDHLDFSDHHSDDHSNHYGRVVRPRSIQPFSKSHSGEHHPFGDEPRYLGNFTRATKLNIWSSQEQSALSGNTNSAIPTGLAATRSIDPATITSGSINVASNQSPNRNGLNVGHASPSNSFMPGAPQLFITTTTTPSTTTTSAPALPDDFELTERQERELQENMTNWLAVMYNRDPELTESLGHQFSDMILRCTMKSVNCTHPRSFENHFTPTEGNCFTYKARTSKRRPGKQSRTIQYEEANLAGTNHGLELVLNLEKNEYISGSSQVGALIMVHHPGDLGYAASEAIFVAPEHTTYIGLKMVNITRLSAPYPEYCVDSWPWKYAANLTRNSTYSQQACIKICLQQTIQRRCSCQSAQLPQVEIDANERIIICDTRKRATRQCVQEIMFRAADRVHTCECPPKCQVIRYDKTISMAKWPTREDKVTFDRGKADINFQNLAKIIVYFQTMTCEEVTQQAVFNAAKLFSALGGIMGMYVGFSFLSVFEIFEVMSRKLWHHITIKFATRY